MKAVNYSVYPKDDAERERLIHEYVHYVGRSVKIHKDGHFVVLAYTPKEVKRDNRKRETTSKDSGRTGRESGGTGRSPARAGRGKASTPARSAP